MEPINLMQRETDAHQEEATANGLAPEFAVLLCCPNCPGRPPLTYRRDGNTLDCGVCRRRYPILGGLPDLRAAAAETETFAGGES